MNSLFCQNNYKGICNTQAINNSIKSLKIQRLLYTAIYRMAGNNIILHDQRIIKSTLRELLLFTTNKCNKAKEKEAVEFQTLEFREKPRATHFYCVLSFFMFSRNAVYGGTNKNIRTFVLRGQCDLWRDIRVKTRCKVYFWIQYKSFLICECLSFEMSLFWYVLIKVMRFFVMVALWHRHLCPP